MNAIVIVPHTSPEIAARELATEMHPPRRYTNPQATLADALTHAACRDAENLIDNAGPWYAGSLPMTAAERDTLRALIAERPHHTETTPRLHTLRERRNATRDIAREHGAHVTPGCCGLAGHTGSAARRAPNSDPPRPVRVPSAVMVSLSGCGCTQCGGGR